MNGSNFKILLYLIFWAPIFIILGIGLYLLLKNPLMNIQTEFRLPEEYNKILIALNKYEEIERLNREEKPKEFSLTTNPFYQTGNIAERDGKSQISSLPFTLSMIINSEGKNCVINQKVYKEGDRIGRFKITKIGDYYVDLEEPKRGKIRLEIGATYHLSK